MESGGSGRRWGALLCGVSLAMALGAPSALAETKGAEPLAEVNGEAITAKDLERSLGARLSKLEEQIYNLKRQELDALVAQRLLAQEAKKRGMTIAALLEAEVTSKVPPVGEDEIEASYQASKPGFRGDEATLRQNIRTALQQQRIGARRRLFVDSLRSKATVVVRLQPPPVTRVTVSVEGAPVRGPAQAPVTLVEFSDFQCPFCQRVQPTLKQLLERYPGKVRLVYRDFPIDSLHPNARRAAEAARCAQDQGKFWEFHDALFANSSKVSADDLGRYAKQVGLDGAAFERCLAGGLHRATVQRDLEEGLRLGVTGTPAFFVNGRSLSGSQSLDALVRVVEDELARIANPRKASQ